jgi:beta-lactamase class A
VVLCGLVGALLAACSGNEPPGTPPTSTASATPPMATATAPATQSSPATATTAAIEPPATAVITPTTEALSLDAYVAELDAAVGRLTGHYGIFVAEPDGTPIYSFGAGDQFEAASLYKLEVMVEVYRQRELGLLDFSEPIYLDELYFAETGEDEGLNSSYAGTYLTVEELLYQMIDASSNAAAWALLDRVGSENVNASMAALGLESTEIRWSPSGDPVSDGGEETVEPADAESTEEAADPESTQEEAPTDEPATEEAPSDDGAPEEVTEEPEPSGSSDDRLADYAFVDEFTPNITTAADIGWLYAQLLQGLVVSPEASAEMLALLTDQQVNDRLPAHLPEGTVVAHKTGNLDGIVHDAGVIYAPAQEVIVVVLSDEVNPDEAIEFIAWLGELTYWRFS